MKKFFTMLMIMAVTAAANAGLVTYGWEDGGTILGNYNPITATIDTEYVHSGNYSLKLVDGGVGTPQAYLGWITGLKDGDVVTAGFWAYDTNAASEYPKGRIWGHYTKDASDITAYGGTTGLSQNNDYTDTGWTYLEATFTFDSMGGTNDGLVIEGRTYTNLGDTIWVDDITISAPDSATIHTPAVPEPASISLVAAGALALYRRRFA